MPLRHTKAGWMWGRKGPFPTKAKALSVARAAYANGFKGEQKNNEPLILESKSKVAFPK